MSKPKDEALEAAAAQHRAEEQSRESAAWLLEWIARLTEIANALGLEGRFGGRYGFDQILARAKNVAEEARIPAPRPSAAGIRIPTVSSFTLEVPPLPKAIEWEKEPALAESELDKLHTELNFEWNWRNTNQVEPERVARLLSHTGKLLHEALRARYMEREHSDTAKRWVRRIKRLEERTGEAMRVLLGEKAE